MNKKVVFCGGGNMAEGIIRGMLKNGIAKEQITVNELRPERCAELTEKYGIVAVSDAKTAFTNVNIAVIAVLPKQVGSVAANLSTLVGKDVIFLSIAAGVSLEMLGKHLGKDRKIARVMPNTIGMTGHGYSGICLNPLIDQEEKADIVEVVNAIGKAMFLDESMFNQFTVLGPTGPLWVYKMIDAMINAGVYQGFSRTDAKNMALENMIGAALLLQMTGEDASQRVAEMCSPGGVTVEGFRALNKGGFDDIIMTSIDEAVKKVYRLQDK